ncbi:MAG: hypothetical protein RJQ04_05675 [Longimicrobiales bacterium]
MNSTRSRALAALGLSLLLGCDDRPVEAEPEPPPPGAAADIRVVEGAGQTGVVGRPLPGPVRFLVTDSDGRPVPGAPVRLIAWDGSVQVPDSLTDAEGSIEATWTLGPQAGEAPLDAWLLAPLPNGGFETVSSVRVTARAEAGPAAARIGLDTVVVAVGSRGPIPVAFVDAFDNLVPDSLVAEARAESSAPEVAAIDAESRLVAGREGSATLDVELGGVRSVVHVRVEPFQALVAREALVLGAAHSCGLASDGRAYCWGENESGALGVGDADDRHEPTPVAFPGAFASLAAGPDHTCGIEREGALWCWGANMAGQLGPGGGSHEVAPVPVAPGTRFIDVAAGRDHTCALTDQGRPLCWGVGTVAASGRPELAGITAVPGATSYRELAAGYRVACGRSASGRVTCWGRSVHAARRPLESPETVLSTIRGGLDICGLTISGQVACRDQQAQGIRFQTDVSGPPIRRLAVGWAHRCGILDSGATWCWGQDDQGQLGRRLLPVSPSRPPGPVEDDPGFVDVAAGRSHTCGVTDEGAVYCWGERADGRLGSDPSRGVPSRPVAVTTDRRFARISVGEQHTCALEPDGSAWCWGSNQTGQLGRQSPSLSSVPLAVSGGLAFRDIRAGGSHTCALSFDDRLLCWGGSTQSRAFEPRTVVDGADILHMDAGPSVSGLTACAVRRGGSIACWPRDYERPWTIPSERGLTTLSLGSSHGCGFDPDGVLLCWGSNNWSQLGRGAPTQTQEPLGPLLTDATFLLVSAGSHTSCAIDDEARVHCWGMGIDGELGDGYEGTSVPHLGAAPQAVLGDHRFLDVQVGSGAACGLDVDRRIVCWGTVSSGVLWQGRRSIPFVLEGDRTFASFAWGAGQHVCGLDEAGRAFCGGLNDRGQTGIGLFADALVPERVATPVIFGPPTPPG